MDKFEAKTLFQLQTELIDMKIEAAAGRGFAHVEEVLSRKFGSLQEELKDLNLTNTKINERLAVIEHELGIQTDKQKEISKRFLDYVFKASWVLLGVVIAFVILMFK